MALLPVLRQIMGQRQFTISLGRSELSAPNAAVQFGRQIGDLRSKIAELDERTRNR